MAIAAAGTATSVAVSLGLIHWFCMCFRFFVICLLQHPPVYTCGPGRLSSPLGRRKHRLHGSFGIGLHGGARIRFFPLSFPAC